MDDLIERQDAIDATKKSRFLIDAMDKIIKLPSVQPEQKTGKWIRTKYFTWECSECHENPTKGTGVCLAKDELYDFCPHCGARMVKDE